MWTTMSVHTQPERSFSTLFQQLDEHAGARSELSSGAALRYNAAVPLDDLDPSPELITALRAERERLDHVLASLLQAGRELELELGAVQAQVEAAVEKRDELARFLGEPESRKPARRRAGRRISSSAPADDGQLRGGAIREAAVRAALAHNEPERSWHYREWLELIEATGQRIHGRDPAATLLTQLSRCPLIVRGPEPGNYRLDRDALVRLRQQRDAVQAEADAKLVRTDNRDYDVIDLAQALAAVEARVKRIDRAIAEAVKLVDRLGATWFFTDEDAAARSSEPHRAVAA
jgi:hypothetical protein